MAKTVIVAELSKKFISVVEIANKNTGPELVRYTVRNIPQTGLNGSWLKAMWEQEHLSRNKIICLLPPSLVRYKSVIVPALPDNELEAAVLIELENINVKHDEIFKIISRQKQDQMYVVKVVAVKNEQLKEHLQVFESADIEVTWYGLRTRGIQNFINYNLGFLENPAEDNIYLDLHEEYTEFGVVGSDEVIYRRDFFSGVTDELLTLEKRDLEEDFFDEIRLSIASYKSMAGNPIPSKLWIFGRAEIATYLIRELSNKLDLNPYIPDRSRLGGVITQKYTPELAPLIGIALDEIGWTHQGHVPIHSIEQTVALAKLKQLYFLGEIGLLAIIFISGILFGMKASIEKQMKVNEWLNRQANLITKLRNTDRQTNQDLVKIKTMEAWLANKGCELEFFLALQQNLPEGTKITDITIDEGVVKDLTGVTPSTTLLLNKIHKAPILKNINLKGTITNNVDGELFHLEGPITQPTDTKKESGK